MSTRNDYYFGGGLHHSVLGRQSSGSGLGAALLARHVQLHLRCGRARHRRHRLRCRSDGRVSDSRPGLSGAIYFGVRYSNTDLSPDDPNGALRGDQFWPKAQIEGEAQLSPSWRANGIIAYTLILDGYWTRARLLYGLSGNKFIGPEVVVQGDPNYNAQKLGVVFGGFEIASKVFLTLKAGYRFQSGADSPYVGAELVGEF